MTAKNNRNGNRKRKCRSFDLRLELMLRGLRAQRMRMLRSG
jgi:hypothetical protein